MTKNELYTWKLENINFNNYILNITQTLAMKEHAWTRQCRKRRLGRKREQENKVLVTSPTDIACNSPPLRGRVAQGKCPSFSLLSSFFFSFLSLLFLFIFYFFWVSCLHFSFNAKKFTISNFCPFFLVCYFTFWETFIFPLQLTFNSYHYQLI